MQQAPNKMNVHITLGEEDGLQFIADSTATITSNPVLVQNINYESLYTEDVGDDIKLVFHFYVEQGKQKEAVAYFMQALDETIDQSHMSPIQKHLRRPKNKGIVDVVETPGCIIIKYRFFPSEGSNEEQLNIFQTEFAKYQKATLQFSSSLKGNIKHNNKNRTNVKVDYVDFKATADEISPSDFTKLVQSMHIQEEDLDFIIKIPAFQMIGNLKSAQFEMKLASFRQLRSFYDKATQYKLAKQDKPFPYQNRGIFRKQISIFGLFKNKIGIKFEGHYNGEDVLMRLLKVYEVFLTKGLNI